MSESNSRSNSNIRVREQSYSESSQKPKSRVERVKEPSGKLKEIPNLQNERISRENDEEKVNHMKKVNSLLVEVDRLTQENSRLVSMLHEEKSNNFEILKKSKKSGKIKNSVDRSLQNDLKREKEEVFRLRNFLGQVENERADLKARLKDYEILTSSFEYEKKNLIAIIQQRTEEIVYLESEKNEFMEKNSLWSQKCDEYENEIARVNLEKNDIKEALKCSELEKAEILSRAAKETMKNSEALFIKSSEIETLKHIHNKHIRLLASKNICMELQSVKFRNSNQVFSKIKETSKLAQAKAIGIRRLSQIPDKYFWRKQKYFLDVWRSSLDWKSTQISRINLLTLYSSKKTKVKAFNQLKKKLQNSKMKNFAGKLLFKLFSLNALKREKSRFSYWKSIEKAEKIKCLSFVKVLIRNFNQKLRKSVEVWKKVTVRLREFQAKEDLAVDFSGLFVRCKFFQALKEHVKEKRMNREMESYKQGQADKFYKISILTEFKRFSGLQKRRKEVLTRVLKKTYCKDEDKALKKWVQGVKVRKMLENINRYVIGKTKIYSEMCKEKVFYAWKCFFTSNKLKSANKELSIERPKRQEFEINYVNAIAESSRNNKINAGKVFFKWFKTRLVTYYSQWKLITKNYSDSLPKIKRIFIKEYMLKIGLAFRLWKIRNSEGNFSNVCKANAKKHEENLILNKHLNLLEDALRTNVEKQQEMKKGVMRRAIFVMKNNLLVVGIRTWAQKALTISNKLTSVKIIEKVLSLHLLNKSVYCLKKKQKSQEKQKIRQAKLKKADLTQSRRCLIYVIEAWKLHYFTLKKIKSTVEKSINRKSLTFKYLSFHVWSSQISSIKLANSIQISEELEYTHNKLIESHHQLSSLHQIEVQNSSHLLKALKKSSKLRIVNALIRCSQNSQRKYWAKWLESNSIKTLKIKNTFNLKRLWNKTTQRQVWKTWNFFVKRKFEYNSRQEIAKHVKNSKSAAREIKGLKSGFEEEILNKNKEINGIQKKVEAGEKIAEFFIARGVRQSHQEYSVSRAAFAFEAMKKRFLMIKYSLLQLAKRIDLLRKKTSLSLIKKTAQENAYINNISELLSEMVNRYCFRYARNRFDQWHRNSVSLHFKKIEKDLNGKKCQIQGLKKVQRVINSKYRRHISDFLMKKVKQKIFASWSAEAVKQKKIQNSSKKFADFLHARNTSKAIYKWTAFVSETKTSQSKSKSSLLHHAKTQLKLCFYSWKSAHFSIKSLHKILSKLDQIHYKSSSIFAFASLKHNSHHQHLYNSLTFKRKSSLLTSLIIAHYKTTLQKYYKNWTNFFIYKTAAFSKTKRIMSRALHSKFRKGLALWKEKCLIRDTIEVVNKSGRVAVENRLLSDRNEVLFKLIQDEGIDSRYIEKYLSEKESIRACLSRKKFKSDTVASKFFVIWRIWTAKRKNITKFAHRLLGYRKKPDLMHGFLTWKKGFLLIAKAVCKYPRKQLYGVIARMGQDIKTLEGKIENTNNELLYMQAYSGILEEHTKRGQNLAIVLCKNNMQRSLFRSISRWQLHTNLCKVHDLLAQLTRTERNFFISQSNFKAIEEENKELSGENNELRQASLDGVAIAEAFEALSREREKLSNDLVERSATVKRLLEKNNDLAFRLRQFGVEEKNFTPDGGLNRRY